jgi:hypothetical protein
MAIRFLTILMLLWIGLSGAAFAQGAAGMPLLPGDDRDPLRPALTITPGEIELGALGPGDEAKAVFHLKNAGSGKQSGTIAGPEGWTPTGNQNLPAIVGEEPEPFRIHLIYVKEVGQGKNRSCSLILRLEAAGQSVAFRREVPAGELREAIRFASADGSQAVFFRARLAELPSAPVLAVEPIRIDFGTVRAGELISKRIILKNRGREPLKWRVGVAGTRGMPATAPPPVGRYVSFRHETAVTGPYTLTGQIREDLELTGIWTEDGGYPSGQGEQNTLRYRFTGTGIRLYFWKSPDGGPFSVFIDEQFIDIIDGFAERRERVEVLIADALTDGPHLFGIVNGGGKVTLEGVHLFGKPIQRGPRGWITVFPDSGSTTRETDYINVTLNARQLLPGIYGEHLLFTSNGGEADVPIFLDVAVETQPRFIDVHRYLAGFDYLYTTNPQAEATRIQVKGYRHTGIAFRLFAPGTPGTTEFFRWFNPLKGDHFYSYDPKGGKPLPGYIFEGSIGNIGTSRLTGTRELYRWFNPTTNGHFYTTEQGGEGITKKGYRFDGIAGFVR